VCHESVHGVQKICQLLELCYNGAVMFSALE